jgi:hypothetical protein
MTPAQAQDFVVKMRKETGATPQAIADALKEKGYVGKTGKPLKIAGVNYILQKNFKVRRRKKATRGDIKVSTITTGTAPRSGGNAIDATRFILRSKLDADTKVKLALEILN